MRIEETFYLLQKDYNLITEHPQYLVQRYNEDDENIYEYDFTDNVVYATKCANRAAANVMLESIEKRCKRLLRDRNYEEYDKLKNTNFKIVPIKHIWELD